MPQDLETITENDPKEYKNKIRYYFTGLFCGLATGLFFELGEVDIDCPDILACSAVYGISHILLSDDIRTSPYSVIGFGTGMGLAKIAKEMYSRYC